MNEAMYQEGCIHACWVIVSQKYHLRHYIEISITTLTYPIGTHEP